MAGEPTAINGMDSTCLPNLFPVPNSLNEDVGKGKPSARSSVGEARGISRERFVCIHKTLERGTIINLHCVMMMAKKVADGHKYCLWENEHQAL